MSIRNGHFIISLDFELYWGMRDKKSISDYQQNLDGTKDASEGMLKLFKEFKVAATWATVGFLFYDSLEKIKEDCPRVVPTYEDANLSPYPYINQNEYLIDKYHFAVDLIKRIKDTPEQEISSHTFSHYYCLEKGQTAQSFKADLESAIKVAKQNNLNVESLVFPRNQYNKTYLAILRELGISCFRGNQKSWFYSEVNGEEETKLRRLMRLVDTYINISGSGSYSLQECIEKLPFDFPASRFFRPYSKKLKGLESLKIKRIKNAMTYAAQHNEIYHLWWHPHNFGNNTEQNLVQLKEIMDHYQYLHHSYQFESISMGKLAQTVIDDDKENAKKYLRDHVLQDFEKTPKTTVKKTNGIFL